MGGGGGHRYENFRAQMRNLLRLRYEKDWGKDMEIIWRTHVETMRGGGGGGTDVKMIEGGDICGNYLEHRCGNNKGHNCENERGAHWGHRC